MTRLGLALPPAYDDTDDYVEGARLAERRGYDLAWFLEDYFLRDTVSVASAVAHATGSIDVGLFLNPYTRHPVLSAMSAASVDEMAGGNALIAMGAGPPVVMERFVDHGEPVRTTREGIEALRRTLADDPAAYGGRRFEMEDVTLGTCPYMPYEDDFAYPREGVPVYVAGSGPKMLELAGHHGDGLMISVAYPPEGVAADLEVVDRGLARGGRDREAFDVVGLVVCARGVTDHAREFTACWLDYHDMATLATAGLDEDAVAEVREAFHEEGLPAAASLVSEGMVKTLMVVGDDPDESSRRLSEYREAGLDVPVLLPLGADDLEATLDVGTVWAEAR